MIAKSLSCSVIGIDAYRVEVEVNIAGGSLPAFNIIGLPDTAIRESRDRIKFAIKNSASSKVIPMAPKTTANFSSPRRTLACLAIWAAMREWGRPEPEKMGSFCPRERVLSPSIDEMPVWIKSLG